MLLLVSPPTPDRSGLGNVRMDSPVNRKKIKTMIIVYPKYRMVLAIPVIWSFEKK